MWCNVINIILFQVSISQVFANPIGIVWNRIKIRENKNSQRYYEDLITKQWNICVVWREYIARVNRKCLITGRWDRKWTYDLELWCRPLYHPLLLQNENTNECSFTDTFYYLVGVCKKTVYVSSRRWRRSLTPKRVQVCQPKTRDNELTLAGSVL